MCIDTRSFDAFIFEFSSALELGRGALHKFTHTCDVVQSIYSNELLHGGEYP